MITNIINKLNIALKVLLLKFLFIKSKYLIPENSILIKCSPKVPNINGRKKLIILGKNEKIFNLKNEFKKTSITLTNIKKNPKYKKVFRLALSGFKTLI